MTDRNYGSGFAQQYAANVVCIEDKENNPVGHPGGGFQGRILCRLYGAQDGIADQDLHWSFPLNGGQHAQMGGIGEGGTRLRPGSTITGNYHDTDGQIPHINHSVNQFGTNEDGNNPSADLDWPQPAKDDGSLPKGGGGGVPGSYDMGTNRYPDSPAGMTAKNPWNYTVRYEHGSEEQDCTPGYERWRHAFASGGMQEWTAHNGGKPYEEGGGMHTHSNPGHELAYIKAGKTGTNDGHGDDKGGGHRRENTEHDHHEEHGAGGNDGQSPGNHTEAHEGNHKRTVGGDSATAVGGGMATGVVGDHSMKVGGNSKQKVDGTHDHIVDGKSNYTHGDDVMFSSTSKITMQVGSSTITMKDGSMSIDSPVVSQSKKFYSGQQNPFDTKGDKSVTQAGPATQQWHLIG